jgi:hypothetical protein
MVAMSMGIVATVASIVKTVELRNLATPDFTYNATNLVYWFISENWLIIIAACIPTLGPLYFVLTGKRTAESFAVPSRPSRAATKWRLTSLMSSWKSRSYRTNSSSGGGNKNRVSAMEKGYLSSPNANP